MVKRALVVDDSKSARFALKRMLNALNLDVDTVESAADAISYLQDHLPDVIFMDHMMPGMDGFEAVKRIKKNPQTAIIPIMMYTSKGGDVYLSQARALGAVGIIRKTIAPVELKSSLLELGIIDDVPHQSTLEMESSGKPQSKTKKLPENSQQQNANRKDSSLDTYIKDLHRLIDDQTIELHRSMWLGIESASNEIFNRLNSDFESKMEKMQAELNEAQTKKSSSFKNKFMQPVYLISVLLLLSLTFNFMLMSTPSKENETVVTEVLPVEIKEDEVKAAVVSRSIDVVNAKLLKRFMLWASNKVIEYPYNEIALNDKRLPVIEEMLKRALEANYKGRIVLQTHVGNFCLSINEVGSYKLADDTLPISSCAYIGNYVQPDDEVSRHQSLGFVNFLSDTATLNQQGIEIEVTNLSRQLELEKYPDRAPNTLAEKWNKAAQSNNRITVILEPDSLSTALN